MKVLILFPMILAIVVYAVIALIVPTYKTARSTTNDNGVLEERLTQQERELKEIDSFTREIQSNNDAVQFLEEFVPTDTAEQEIINAISNYASKHNVSLESINLGQDTKSNNATQNPVGTLGGSIQVVGNYQQLLSFMRDMFYIKRLYTFNTSSIDVTDESFSDSEEEARDVDRLALVIDFSYGYINEIPSIGIAEFGDKLSFEKVIAIAQQIESVKPIDITTSSRANPFLP